MKVACLLGSLNRGGTETLLLDVFRNAKRAGLEAIGIYRKTGAYEKDFLASGVEMQQLSTGKNPFQYLKRLRTAFINQNVTIVHAQQPIDAFYAYWATLWSGIKVVLTFHGYDFNEKGLSRWILRFIIKRTDLNIYVSDTQREYYTIRYKLNPEKQQVVYNGISFDKFDYIRGTTQSRTPNRKNLRTELQLSNDTLLLGSIGNFNAVRDQFTICRFLKLLKDEKVDFHFVFAGKRVDSVPQLYDQCMEFCHSNKLDHQVSFLGVRDDVPAILNQLDTFIYSTDHDTFGIAVVEAMAVGIPVFVNDWGVMNEITENGKYATIYKTKDEQDLLRQFLVFLQNRKLFQDKAEEAADCVRQKFSIENHIAELKMKYEEAVNG